MISWEEPAIIPYGWSIQSAGSTSYSVTGSTALTTTSFEVVTITDEDGTTTTTETTGGITGTQFTSITTTTTNFAVGTSDTSFGTTTSSSSASGLTANNASDETYDQYLTSTTGQITVYKIVTTEATVDLSYITTETRSEESLLTTTWQTVSSLSATTTMESTFVGTTTQIELGVGVVSQSGQANASHSVYLANTGTWLGPEILYVAGTQPSALAQQTTRTTISALATIIPIATFGASDTPVNYAGVFAESQSFSYASLALAGETESTTQPASGIPILRAKTHGETTTQIYTTVGTTLFQPQSSANFSHYGNTVSYTSFVSRSTKATRYHNGTLEYHIPYTTAQQITIVTTAASAVLVGTTDFTEGNYTYGSTTLASGNSSFALNASPCGVQSSNFAEMFGANATQKAQRSIYRSVFAFFNGASSKGFDLNQDLPVDVSLGQSLRAGGNTPNSALYDQTRDLYTISKNSVTWRGASNTSNSNYSITDSTALSFDEEAPLTALYAVGDALGGTFYSDETVVESIPRGAWSLVNQSTTTFVENPNHYIASSQNSDISFYKKLAWNEIGKPQPVVAALAFYEQSPPMLETQWPAFAYFVEGFGE